MKVTILSEIDYASSALKLADAISLHTDINIKVFTGKYYNPFKHPQRSRHTKRDIQHHIDQSDIVHLKGDFPPQAKYMGIKILHKPVIVSVSGSLFRKKRFWGFEKYKLSDYDHARLKTAFTPDLLYPQFSSLWTPHPINSYKQATTWKRSVHPILIHTPTDRAKKNTEFVIEVFRKLSRRIKIETEVLENVPFRQVVEARKEATIFFDQFRVGFYGNSALEAMQYGIPTAAWISPMSIEQAKGQLDDCPVITAPKKVNLWVDMLEKIIDSDLEKLSARTKHWCDTVHSYQAVAKLWKGIYESI